MSKPVLVIGNKTYSSWSMRPWLALRWGGIAFEERVIPLGMGGYGKSKNADIRAASPSGRVPVLQIENTMIWDSLAISEWAAERAPQLWPKDANARAVARSAAAEMHSGFAALRRDLPMNTRRIAPAPRELGEDCAGDIARIVELWVDLRTRFGAEGPYLFGARSIADAFYAPVATRFKTYQVPLPADAQAYCETILNDDAVALWCANAKQEIWAVESTDAH
jgi:glutathione S-transferase